MNVQKKHTHTVVVRHFSPSHSVPFLSSELLFSFHYHRLLYLNLKHRPSTDISQFLFRPTGSISSLFTESLGTKVIHTEH